MSRAHDKIAQKKQELESSLVRIQEGLDHSIDQVKGGFVESLSPKEIVKRYPLPVLGASLLIGFLLGSKGGSSKKRSSSTSSTIVNSISKSLKKRLAQKAIDTALDFIDDKLKEQKED